MKNTSRDEDKRLREKAPAIVEAALREDIGEGDITTTATVARSRKGACRITAKEDLVLAGSFLARMVFGSLDGRIKYRALAEDGAPVRRGQPIAEVSGPLAPMLTGERVALNFLQRLSGIRPLQKNS